MFTYEEVTMKNFVKYLSFFAVVALAFMATDALASNNSGNMMGTSGGDAFAIVLARMVTTFQNVRSVIFVVGGFGLVGLAFAAIFGKVKWPWLAALAVGLAIVAIAGAIVDYVTQSGAAQKAFIPGEVGDTLY